MRFSLIISVYQTAAHLGACVQSIIAQGFADFEIILIDDGSTDDSWDICEKWAQQDPRIQAHRQNHRGVSCARNLGLSLASGDYLSFFDSDDTITPKTLETIDSLITESSPDWIIFSINHLDLTQSRSVSTPWQLQDEYYSHHENFITDLICGKRLLLYSCANKFYRRDLVLKQQLQFSRDTDFGEDRLFNFAYLRHARTIRTCSHLGYNYHIRSTPSLSQRYRPAHSRELLFLHRAKSQLIQQLAPSLEPTSFLATDLYFELQAALRHLIRHWSSLSTQEKQQEIDTFTSLDHPPYLETLKQRTLKTRLLITLIQYRLNVILRLLLTIKSQFNAIPPAAV